MFKHKKGNHNCDTPKSKPVQKWANGHPEKKTTPRLTSGLYNKHISIVNDIIILMFKIVTSWHYDHNLVLLYWPYKLTVITIINYDHKTFIVQATDHATVTSVWLHSSTAVRHDEESLSGLYENKFRIAHCGSYEHNGMNTLNLSHTSPMIQHHLLLKISTVAK